MGDLMALGVIALVFGFTLVPVGVVALWMKLKKEF